MPRAATKSHAAAKNGSRRCRPGSATSAKPAASAAAKPRQLKPDLIEAVRMSGLQQYARKLEDIGLVSVVHLAKLRRPQMDELVEQLRPLPGHKVRLLNLFEEHRARYAARRARPSRSTVATANPTANPTAAVATPVPLPAAAVDAPAPWLEAFASAAGVPSLDEDAAVAFLARSWAAEMAASIRDSVPPQPKPAREAPTKPPRTLPAPPPPPSLAPPPSAVAAAVPVAPVASIAPAWSLRASGAQSLRASVAYSEDFEDEEDEEADEQGEDKENARAEGRGDNIRRAGLPASAGKGTVAAVPEAAEAAEDREAAELRAVQRELEEEEAEEEEDATLQQPIAAQVLQPLVVEPTASVTAGREEEGEAVAEDHAVSSMIRQHLSRPASPPPPHPHAPPPPLQPSSSPSRGAANQPSAPTTTANDGSSPQQQQPRPRPAGSGRGSLARSVDSSAAPSGVLSRPSRREVFSAVSFVLQRHVAARGPHGHAHLIVRAEPAQDAEEAAATAAVPTTTTTTTLEQPQPQPLQTESEVPSPAAKAEVAAEVAAKDAAKEDVVEAGADEVDEGDYGEEAFDDDEEEEEEEADEEEDPLDEHALCVAVALADFAAEEEGELSFGEGEALTLLLGAHAPDGWWLGCRCDGAAGLVPQSYVEPRPELPTGVDPGGRGGAGAGGGRAAVAAQPWEGELAPGLLASPEAPRGMARALQRGIDCIDGLRYSLELSPVTERNSGRGNGGVGGGGEGGGEGVGVDGSLDLEASVLWEGGWAKPEEPLAIFDERRHPLYPGHVRHPPGVEWPTPTVREVSSFISTLSATARMDPETSVCGLAYVERLLGAAQAQGLPGRLEAHTWRRVVLTAWLVANKMWDDDSVENLEYAELFGFSADDLNRLEQAFVAVLGYNLSLRPNEYARYYFALRSICQDHDGGLRPLDDALAARLQRRANTPAALIAAGWAAEGGGAAMRRSL